MSGFMGAQGYVWELYIIHGFATNGSFASDSDQRREGENSVTRNSSRGRCERFCRETYRMLWKLRNKTPNLVWGIQNHFPEDMTSKLNLEGQREFGLGLLQMRNYTRKRKKERKYALNDIFFSGCLVAG